MSGAAGGALLLLTLLLGQDAKSGEKAQPGPLQAIVAEWVLPVAGPPIHHGVVLFRDGKIVRVGAELPLEGAQVHRAEGRYVCPGFVAVEAARIGVPGAPGKMGDGLDPYQRDLKIALASGITAACVVETGFGGFFGMESPMPFGNSSAVIKTTVGDLEGMLLKEPAAIYFSFRDTPLGVFQLRDRFRRAAEHRRRVGEAERAKTKPPDLPSELEIYARILRDEVPVIVVVSSLEEIRTILEVRRQFPFQLVLRGAPGGWKLAPELAAQNVPVLIKARGPDFSFDLSSPAIPEDGLIPIRAPAAFAEAGVRVAILPYRRGVSLDGLGGRDLTALALDAAFAVRGGMQEEAALAAITLDPARILRVADRVGSLEPGKDADFLILTRHPLDYRACVETAWINGKVYYERAKSPLFREIPVR